jgi:hypothetical protein
MLLAVDRILCRHELADLGMTALSGTSGRWLYGASSNDRKRL